MISFFARAFNELQRDIHDTAKAKGWYDGAPRTALEAHMLIVSEIAEATEEVRKGTPPLYFEGPSDNPLSKPEGELVEIADAIIRAMDYCASRGWDLGDAIERKHTFNKTRPYRHGGKAK
jgi:hypothetical protein